MQCDLSASPPRTNVVASGDWNASTWDFLLHQNGSLGLKIGRQGLAITQSNSLERGLQKVASLKAEANLNTV